MVGMGIMNLSEPIALYELLAHLPDGLVMLDQRGGITACNDNAQHLLASPQRHWNGRLFLDVIVGSPLEIDLRALLAPPIVAAKRQFIYERADGIRAVELQLCPLYADDPGAGALLIVRDRTDYARLEQAREQRVRELSALNRLARAANIAFETDELLRAITRELARILPGIRIAIGLLQPDGTTMRLMVDRSLRSAPTLEAQAATEYDVTQLQHILRAGQPLDISVADPWLARTPLRAMLQHIGMRAALVAPLANAVTPLGALFFGYSDQRMIAPNEVQLFASVGELVAEGITRTRQAEEIREASRAKSMLLATVSHELRTPLSSIVGYIDMLEQGVFGELSEGMHQPLGRMRQGGMALLRLINDILDFSKIEAGYLAIDLEPVDMATVIQDVVGALQPQIQGCGLAVTVMIAPDLPQVQANSARLAQVLTNLIANAIKFTARGSIIVRVICHGERVQFSVTDTGIGIASEQQHLLFQEFRQIENVYTRRHIGTGLGLAISRQLMQLMGGTLTMESTPGVGSTFYGELPIVPKELLEKERNGMLR
jgi:signal transduction histidine kinase